MHHRPLPVSAPPRVAARLRGAVDSVRRILHTGPDAVYVDLDGWCVGVLSEGATRVPCGLRTRLASVPSPTVVDLVGGVLHLDGVPLLVGRLDAVLVPRLDRTPAPLRVEVGELVGAGDGLTPYGDDVLCGWLAVHRAAGIATPETDAAIRDLLPRTTALSATLLDCAMHGEVVPEFAAYLAALGTEREQAATAALVAVGGSSGAGLLEGAQRALGASGALAA